MKLRDWKNVREKSVQNQETDLTNDPLGHLFDQRMAAVRFNMYSQALATSHPVDYCHNSIVS